MREVSRKLFTALRQELLARTCETFGPAHIHRMFIVSPKPNLTFTDTILVGMEISHRVVSNNFEHKQWGNNLNFTAIKGTEPLFGVAYLYDM
jgi:hypothetical protein